MNSIQKIESAVYAIRPELKELSFGCRIKYYHTTETEGDTRIGIYVGPFDDGIKTIYNGNSEYVRDYENLGHPITLQDILLAMDGGEREWSMTTSGQFMEHNADGNWYVCTKPDEQGNIEWLPEYSLSLSPYDQSEDTLHFIAENIK